MRVDEIQERLIKNKTLLNVIEPSLENPSLEVLLGILQRRIELDKECLFQFNQLKKDRRLLMTSSRNPSVAPAIMRFQKGCQQVGRTEENSAKGGVQISCPHQRGEGGHGKAGGLRVAA